MSRLAGSNLPGVGSGLAAGAAGVAAAAAPAAPATGAVVAALVAGASGMVVLFLAAFLRLRKNRLKPFLTCSRALGAVRCKLIVLRFQRVPNLGSEV